MPLAQYFFFVGGLMLALLFVLDAFIPKSPAAVRTAANLPVIRIHSDWKLPEPVVIDTSSTVPARITIMESNVPAALRVVDFSSLETGREAFAELPRPDVKQPILSDPRQRKAKDQHVHRKRNPATVARVLWVSGTPHGSATALGRVSTAIQLA